VYDFEAVTAAVKAQLPSGMAVTEVLRRQTGDPAAQQTILATLNAGPTLVTYAGHGAYQFWRGDLLTAAEAATPDLDVRRTWILFGDPTMRLMRMP
jgi:hypothetical protein